MKWTLQFALAALVALVSVHSVANASSLKTVGDAELRENGNENTGNDATSINARYNNNDRNEWIALKFDLSAYSDKSLLTDVSLNTFMFRSNSNNSKNLDLYAISPGTAGEDWDETTITYGDMPGFTFDADSSTNILDVGGELVDLGTFNVSGVENANDIAVLNPPSLTTLVQGMGSNNLLTLLMTTADITNGQWRIASKEATSLDGGANPGVAGDYAAFLEFTVIPEPGSFVLMSLFGIALLARHHRA